ncbi:MgtC/SapB family protein [Caenimonas sp. SL110]|uniref:MgtC/SapB family protein n=1 Tax=Caenimonas sp. SL110 TaxID=1450524 RepID=UPI0009E1C4F7|nr:MgtC/SapB family protein [Caenimonas sp. SL110]
MNPSDLDLAQGAKALGAALAVGLMVGLERGWRDRELPEGGRVAGLRTFALIGLLGGLLALLGSGTGQQLLLASGLLAVVLLFAVSFRRASEAAGSLSITTAVAAMATFGLGALAAHGHAVLAVGAAVVVALLLDLKPELHRWMRLIQPDELNAILQLGVLSAVVLPLLPDAGYGPYKALNPYQLWLAVVLVAALSLFGHAAMRLRGARQGLLWMGLFGGLASSTAATLALARAARAHTAIQGTAAAAIMLASSVMFFRMAVLVVALQPELAAGIGLLLVLPGVTALIAAAALWRRGAARETASIEAQVKVFDLPTALGFGVVLGIVAVAIRAGKQVLGDAGIYGIAFISGLADVDAILVSSVQMHEQGQLAANAATTAILLAAGANLVSKAALAFGIGGAKLGWRVLSGFGAIAVVGAVGYGWQYG